MSLDSQLHHQDQEDHWIPLSDLMTGLMMFFMLLAVAFMVKVEADTQKVKQIAVLYDQLRTDLYQDLDKEFHRDLPKWGAELDKDLTIRFKEPDVLFDTGASNIKPSFRAILDEFFPRYVAILSSSKYKDSIEEIRIEGHTSSFWRAQSSADEAYFKNMDLSQSRTRATLEYVMSLSSIQPNKIWLRKFLTANGLSSSKPITEKDGRENAARSQRVEFRVRTDADARIATILDVSK
jgi:outer membrane protein OmpA-like peptidoglycan-associated protein